MKRPHEVGVTCVFTYVTLVLGSRSKSGTNVLFAEEVIFKRHDACSRVFHM